MNITEEDIRRIVREEIEAYFQRQAQGGNVVAEPQGEYNAIRDAEDDLYKRAMAAMDATLVEQENPSRLQPHRSQPARHLRTRHPLGNRDGLWRIVSS